LGGLCRSRSTGADQDESQQDKETWESVLVSIILDINIVT
jgi:hypothetical protein